MSGKDGGWILPTEIDPERVCIKLFVPNDPAHLAAFWGALWNLTYWNQWQRDPLKQGTQVAAVWKDVWFDARAINDGLEGCEIVPFDVRQNEETPCILEKTEDGDTWTPFADLRLCPPSIALIDGVAYYVDPVTGAYTPLSDAPPATPPAPRPIPPREGSEDDNRCLTAANAVNVLLTLHQSVAAAYNPAIALLMLASVVVGAVATVLSYGLGVFVVVAYMDALLAVASALTFSAFSTEVQDELRCILYCAASDNGSGVVTFDFAQVESELDARTDIDIWTAIDVYVSIIGESGLNQAGATTAITDAECDCPDCPTEWCYEWKYTNGNFDDWEPLTTVYGDLGTLTADGWQSLYLAPPITANSTQAYITIDTTATLTRIEVDVLGTNPIGTTTNGIYVVDQNLSEIIAEGTTGVLSTTLVWEGSRTITGILRVNTFTNEVSDGNPNFIQAIRLWGTGSNPFGEDNCEE